MVINDITDLFRALDENPQWREELRRRILTEELLAMPDQLAQLTVKVDQLVSTVAENSRQIAQLAETTAENSRLIEENSRQIAENSRLIEENSRQIADLKVIAQNHTLRMDRMENDMGDIKAMFTEARPERTARDIAEALQLHDLTIVDDQPLRQFADRLGLDPDTRRSFTRADLVFHAKDAAEATAWCAAEISWTVALRDLDRARRNADFIQQATGQKAYSVVCGHRYDLNLDWTDIIWIDLSKN